MVSQFKTRVTKLKAKEIVPGLTKFNSLFSQKSSLFECRKEASYTDWRFDLPAFAPYVR